MNNIDIYQVNNIGLWNANSSSNIAPNSTRLNFLEGAANEDGTVIALGAPYPPPSLSENVFVGPEILDFNQDSVGFIEQSFDMAEGGPPPQRLTNLLGKQPDWYGFPKPAAIG